MIPEPSRAVRSLLAPSKPKPTLAEDPLARAVSALAEAVAAFKESAGQPINVHVPEQEPPVLTVELPTEKPRRMRFTIHRDRSGRIDYIDAETLT